jgi:hypothetical protein
VPDPRPDLFLKGVLYWLVFAAVIAFTMAQFPLKALLRWKLPTDLDVFQICMLVKITKTEGDNYKGLLLSVAINMITFIHTIIFHRRSQKFVRKLCPAGKMSCIGRYNRNVISLKTTAVLAVSVTAQAIAYQFLLLIFQFLTPDTAFFLDSIFLTVFCDIFYVCLGIALMRRDMPTITESKRRTQFYVTKPIKIEPRSRPSVPKTNTDEVRQKNPTSSKSIGSSRFIYVKPFHSNIAET